MGDIQLVQRIEENVFNKIESKKDQDEKDKSLSELLSEDNIKKARSYFADNFKFKNYELNNIYTEIIANLFEDLVIKDGKIFPEKVINPTDTDNRFLELYSALFKLDEHLTDYKKYIRQNKAAETNIESKIDSAKSRLETVQEKLKCAESEKKGLDNNETNHDLTKLKLDIDKYNDEINEINEQIIRHKKRLKFLNKELKDYILESPLRSCFDISFKKAKDLNLESTLNFEVPMTGKALEDIEENDMIQKNIKGIQINIDTYVKPKEPKIIPFLNKWRYALFSGFAAMCLTGFLGYSALKKPEINKKGIVNNIGTPRLNTKTEPIFYDPEINKAEGENQGYGKIVGFDPDTLELSIIPPGYKNSVKYKLDLARIGMPNMKYVPGKIKVSFDSDNRKLTLKHPKVEKVIWNFEQLPRKKMASTWPDVILSSYRQEGNDPFDIYEVTELYALLEDNCTSLSNIKGPDRKVPKSEIMGHLKEIAGKYEVYNVKDANMMINGFKIIDAKYEHSKGLLTLINQNNVDIPIHLENRIFLTNEDYDNIPDALMHPSGNMVYFDLSKNSKDVKCIKTGKNFNNILHFFPVQNITLKF